jgi:lipoprotein-anchoring transpeptidase ErfK/SrfK
MNHPILRSVVRRLLAGATLVTVALTLSNCKTRPAATTGSAKYSINYDPPAHRPTNASKVRVKISTGAQRLYVTEGSKVLLATPCSVGRSGTPTPPRPHPR